MHTQRRNARSATCLATKRTASATAPASPRYGVMANKVMSTGSNHDPNDAGPPVQTPYQHEPHPRRDRSHMVNQTVVLSNELPESLTFQVVSEIVRRMPAPEEAALGAVLPVHSRKQERSEARLSAARPGHPRSAHQSRGQACLQRVCRSAPGSRPRRVAARTHGDAECPETVWQLGQTGSGSKIGFTEKTRREHAWSSKSEP